jgi:hypothetical protein
MYIPNQLGETRQFVTISGVTAFGYTAIGQKIASEGAEGSLGTATNFSLEGLQALVFCDNPRSSWVVPELSQGRSPRPFPVNEMNLTYAYIKRTQHKRRGDVKWSADERWVVEKRVRNDAWSEGVEKVDTFLPQGKK